MNKSQLLLALVLLAGVASAFSNATSYYYTLAYEFNATPYGKGVDLTGNNYNCTVAGAASISSGGLRGFQYDAFYSPDTASGCTMTNAAGGNLLMSNLFLTGTGSVTMYLNRTGAMSTIVSNRVFGDADTFSIVAYNTTHLKARIYDGGAYDDYVFKHALDETGGVFGVTYNATDVCGWFNGSIEGCTGSTPAVITANRVGIMNGIPGYSGQYAAITELRTRNTSSNPAEMFAEFCDVTGGAPLVCGGAGLTVNVTDAWGNYSGVTFDVSATNATNTTAYYGLSSPAVLTASNTPWGTVTVCVNASGYLVPSCTTVTWNGTNPNSTSISMVPYGLNVTIRDESTGALLDANLNSYNSTTTYIYARNTNNYLLNISQLATGSSHLLGWRAGYQNRTYDLTITSLTSGTYTIALLNSSIATLYTVYVRNLGGSAIPNAAYNVTRTVAGSTVTVATGNADTNGVFTVYLEFGASYTFELAAFGYASASTPVTATTLNPITIVLYSSLGVPTWNVTYSSIIVTYTGQPLVQGQTSLRSVNASYWLYDTLVFTGACATYYYNNTLLLNYSCGATNNVTNTSLTILPSYSGFVLQAFTVTANGTNNTFLTWLPILTSGSGGSPAYHKGIVALIAERFQAGDPTGLSTGAFSFLIIIASLLVATFIGGATVMSTLIFLLMLALFTFILPILSWWYFTIIAVVAVAWIYLRGG